MATAPLEGMVGRAGTTRIEPFAKGSYSSFFSAVVGREDEGYNASRTEDRLAGWNTSICVDSTESVEYVDSESESCRSKADIVMAASSSDITEIL